MIGRLVRVTGEVTATVAAPTIINADPDQLYAHT